MKALFRMVRVGVDDGKMEALFGVVPKRWVMGIWGRFLNGAQVSGGWQNGGSSWNVSREQTMGSWEPSFVWYMGSAGLEDGGPPSIGTGGGG